jgi:hypothetical protein
MMLNIVYLFLLCSFLSARDPFHSFTSKSKENADIKLVGIMRCKGSICGFIQDIEGNFKEVFIGDEIDEWRVVHIVDTHIELKNKMNHKQLVVQISQ